MSADHKFQIWLAVNQRRIVLDLVLFLYCYCEVISRA